MMVGDVRICCLPNENGVLKRSDHHHLRSPSDQIPPPPVVSPSVMVENWERAEQITWDIICRIHPTVEANCKRKEVIEYAQGLLNSSLGFEIFPYGSVPLKTYLPDGDIDLTAICNPALEDALFSDVHAVLKREEQNKDVLYEVKDVHCIDAEVKLVKCIVQNMVVDISFNQLGGLSTLCFFEQVDHIVGKNHLFKRSIILIKAWCYYESRILGAHHGLISTYALETLVLYIFHQFHSSLNGPLVVLYRFLNYFSKFDWDNYCLSISGPVCKSSLPNIAAEPPENGRDELLLSDEFLRKCVDMFSVPSRIPDMNSRPFPQKHLNIVDPLKENNNLGRSVNRGNFYRIRSAFKFGARTLTRILSLPSEKMIYELNKFFANTLGRHGWNHCTHMQNSCLVSGARNADDSSASSSSSLSDTSSEDSLLLKTVGCSDDRPIGKSCNASHCHFSCSCGENRGFENEICRKMPNSIADDEIICSLRSESKDYHFVINDSACSCANHELQAPFSSVIPTLVCNISENLTPTLGVRDIASISGNSESFNSLLDLSGDYESHFRSAVFGQYSHFYSVSAPMLPCPPMLLKSENRSSWEVIHQSLQLKKNAHSQIKKNGVMGQQQQQFHLNPPPPAPFNTAFNSEEKKKRRGTGTYIPNMNYHPNRDWLYLGRGKNHATRIKSELCRHANDNGSATLQKIIFSECGHELSEAEFPYLGNGKPVPSEVQVSQPSAWSSSNVNDFCHPSERNDSECQSLELQEGSLKEGITPQDSCTSSTCASASSRVATGAEGSDEELENDHERVTPQLYHLKDEVDFPPLSHRKALGTR